MIHMLSMACKSRDIFVTLIRNLNGDLIMLKTKPHFFNTNSAESAP